jgi:hypothetical protein
MVEAVGVERIRLVENREVVEFAILTIRQKFHKSGFHTRNTHAGFS